MPATIEPSPIRPPSEYGARVHGCLFGGAIGDALGAPVEFLSLGEIRKRYGPDGVQHPENGQITDDTQMTLFTAEGLIRADRRPSADRPANPVQEMRYAYHRWLSTQRLLTPQAPSELWQSGWLLSQKWLHSRRAPGKACLSGLAFAVLPGLNIGGPGPVNPRSKGCGAVMRSAPFGLTLSEPRAVFELATRCAMLTHGHPTGYLAAGALAVIIRYVLDGIPVREGVGRTLHLLVKYRGHEETTAALNHAVALADANQPTPETIERIGGGWVAEEALAIAVYCALVSSRPGDVSAALRLAVNHSGDSDSTGAICGNILGAEHGAHNLPPDWVTSVEGRDTIAQLADDFVAQFTGEGQTLAALSERYPVT